MAGPLGLAELFTPVRYDSLPGPGVPGEPDSYPAATTSSPT